ncbi:MAG TPA: helix-turn-helix transcriptional regulator [Candidatus Fimihabitans intestinipullorum]|uniref:Helix-turn-helix transcriptional regulator n=1 Tax=Candidatus Fimihabitans intestinipullorum TaxID=2840820 RepID=A0A9D1HTZ3_9BACT|nr:helix-turn-helix transcriptional regulator [Candidatus Fimihabitans intestinipullorum]
MISKYLKQYFKNRNISQYEVSKRTKIDRTKINLSFNNKRKLTADELILIANVFEIDLNKIKKIK